MKNLKLSIFLFFIFFISICIFCKSNNAFFTFISEEKEVELGKFYIPSFIDKFEGLYPEKRVQKYINHLGLKIAKVTDIINAFALPGEPVIITRELFLQLDNESQLVGILAHELGHINARHHVKFLEKTVSFKCYFSKMVRKLSIGYKKL